jgi:hypothetical protein
VYRLVKRSVTIFSVLTPFRMHRPSDNSLRRRVVPVFRNAEQYLQQARRRDN